ATPYAFDRGVQKGEKTILNQHWGDWSKCKARLPRGHARSLVDYLVSHPVDFRGAIARLRPELGSLYLSAYQSHLWNRMLARTIERLCRPEQISFIKTRLGELPVQRQLDPPQREVLVHVHL